jgi:hypothetical protein
MTVSVMVITVLVVLQRRDHNPFVNHPLSVCIQYARVGWINRTTFVTEAGLGGRESAQGRQA